MKLIGEPKQAWVVAGGSGTSARVAIQFRNTWLIFAQIDAVPMDSPNAPASPNPFTVEDVLTGMAKESAEHPSMSTTQAAQVSVDHLMATGNPVETYGKGALIPGTGLRLDDPRIRFVMLRRKRSPECPFAYSVRAARVAIAKLTKGAPKALRYSKQRSTADFHAFPVWPDSKFIDPFGVLKGDNGFSVIVGQPRGRAADLVPHVTQIPGFEVLDVR